MDDALKSKLKYLRLYWLLENWDQYLKEAEKGKSSLFRTLNNVIEKEYEVKLERSREARIKKAGLTERLVIETYPFSKQPELKKKVIMEIYDSLSYVKECRDLIFIGPTGCGKTGLATSFLLHAINNGYRGQFIEFGSLVRQLYQSKGDLSENVVLKAYSLVDVLLIDEIGYENCTKEIASLFFELMRCRHKKKSTIITTQLGFDEWSTFLGDVHLTAALLDRVTSDCVVFNMKNCVSIRDKNITYGT